MVVDSSEIRYLKDKLFNILNSKMNIKELTDNINNSNIDPEIKNLLILLYSNIVNHENEIDRDRIFVLTQLLEHINIISKEVDKIENELHFNKNIHTDRNHYEDNTHNVNEIQNINNSNTVVNTVNNNPTKWYLNFKNIFLGGITFLPIIGGLTVIYSYNPEAAEKAVEVFFNIMIKIFLPGV